MEQRLSNSSDIADQLIQQLDLQQEKTINALNGVSAGIERHQELFSLVKLFGIDEQTLIANYQRGKPCLELNKRLEKKSAEEFAPIDSIIFKMFNLFQLNSGSLI